MIERFLNALLTNRWKGFRVIHRAVLPAREPRFAALPQPLPEVLNQSLLEMGIRNLYCHQALAVQQIRLGRDVVVATPTSSGKSLIYNLTVAEALLQDDGERALYLFPTKALSRDQSESLKQFFEMSTFSHLPNPFRTAIYDGDTTPHERAKIRARHPHILISNPDMLHYALLPYHGKWESFWHRLRFVIVDEMHSYRGVFGSHVAQVFWRLQRVCRHYGSRPQFILLSATIANPAELAGQLIHKPAPEIVVVPDNGAPQARRHFVFLESEEGVGAAVSTMAARLLVKAMEAGLKTIAFTQSRRTTELIHMSVQRMAPALARRVSSYRAGFLPEERRVVEQKLAGGQLSAVISTSALEMGIDIGGLDLCILVGYPGTVMNTWQRGGRVGRGGQESAIILIPQADALDQYIIHHPQEFLDSHYEIAVTDPLNEEVLKAHLPCAAAELPLERSEVNCRHKVLGQLAESLAGVGRLLETGDGMGWVTPLKHPHRQVDIRSVGPSYVILHDSGNKRQVPIGRNEGSRALKECHPGAIYLHRGRPYAVKELDLGKRVIRVEAAGDSYFTRVKSEKETEILEVLATKPVGNFLARLGRLRVTEHILAYEMRQLFNHELLGTNSLDLPPQTFETVGFWMEIEPAVARRVQDAKQQFMGGIHAVEHAAISMFPLFALCDRNDIGGIASPLHPQLGKGAIFIYDGYPGGIGLAARGYEIIQELLEKTKELIAACTCEEGCPACIHSPKCGSGNKPLDKAAALSILKYLMGEWNLGPKQPASSEGQPGQGPPGPVEDPPRQTARIGFFDLETQRLADEVGGWQNKHLMRVSVAVLYESPSDTFAVYREPEVPAFLERLRELDLIVGFNIRNFDLEVLKAYSTTDLRSLPTFDLLHEIHKILGFRLSLSHLAEHNLGRAKSSDGVQAVQWFRQGEWDRLIEYCKEDVIITRELFEKALETGHLMFCDRRGRVLRIPTPWDLETLLGRRVFPGNL